MQLVDAFKKRLEFNRIAFDTVKKNFSLGMSEKQIKEQILAAWDCAQMEFSGDVCAEGRIEGDATDYVLKQGDTLVLDLQPGWEDCYCDTTRTFFIGAPSEEQQKAYAAVCRALRTMEQVLATHPRACDVYFAMQETLAEEGYSCPHHAGHAVGKEKFLQPQLVAKNTAQLEQGMIIAMEPGVYFDGKFGIRIENNYLLTEDGIQELFNYPLELKCFVI